MSPTTPLPDLPHFRQAVYRTVLGHRKDSLVELLDALTTGTGPTALVRLSLEPAFRRQGPSAPDALADGAVHPTAAHRLLPACVPPPDPARGDRPVWVVDGTIWPRPQARASPARTSGRRPLPARPAQVIVPGWESQWLLAAPEATGRWALPVEVRRRDPDAATPTQTAIAHLTAVLPHTPAGSPRPVVTFDSGSSPVDLARARLAVDGLLRLPSRRRFFRPPGPYRGRGCRSKHGPGFRLPDLATHGVPDRTGAGDDLAQGRVAVAVWEGLHDQAVTDVPLSVVRIQVSRLPRRDRSPAPLWLAWVGGPLPDDLTRRWRR